jgi:hypothetical protein
MILLAYRYLIAAALLFGMSSSLAADGAAAALSGREIMERVDARDDGEHVTRDLTFRMTDRGGSTRVERITGHRAYFEDEKRTILFYTDPTNVRGTGFLTFDYLDPEKDDDQWLYLPALRKIRRISSSDRGDYFLGTDFTYEEIKKEQKIELADFTFRAVGTERLAGADCIVVEGDPVNSAIASELGYSKVVWRVDPGIWMSRRSDYYDINDNHLKTIHLERVQRVDGVLTVMETFVENHKTGHSTRLTFSSVDYEEPVPQSVFTPMRLRRGL